MFCSQRRGGEGSGHEASLGLAQPVRESSLGLAPVLQLERTHVLGLQPAVRPASHVQPLEPPFSRSRTAAPGQLDDKLAAPPAARLVLPPAPYLRAFLIA